jgi:hypothetical protein
VGDAPGVLPITQLAQALRAEKTRFIVVGMSAAILQGVPSTTLDFDLWIDLLPRQYIRILNICLRLGAEIVANTVVVFGGQLTVNFIYRIDGLRSFDYEYRRAKRLKLDGETVPVLPLDRIYKSKKAVGRAKDLAALPVLEQTMGLLSKSRKGRSRS